ncbi:gliding motility-associated C-terminal domain-containing protein [bacterium SCSIO 12741]|nr:gliding motility-associated C-terminal domain-containing protein [bacterium SCSIO 12741]
MTLLSLPFWATLQAETDVVKPLTILGPENAVCAGKSVELKATGGQNFEFIWSPGNLFNFPDRSVVQVTVNQTTTVKVVRIHKINMSRDSAYFTIRINEKKTEIRGNTYICSGDSSFLKIDTKYTRPIWSTGERSYGIWVKTPGIYSVVANEGCIAVKGELFVSSKTKPVARIMPDRSTDLCLGQKVVLTSFSPDHPSWSTGETAKSIVVSTDKNITLTNSNECGVATEEISVKVRHVNAHFTTDEYKGEAPLKINFYNSSEKASRYSWYLNGQLFSEEQDPDLLLSEPGFYKVRLIAFNQWGCRSDMIYDHFQVTEPRDRVVQTPGAINDHVIFPNSFSPNGDGLNDEFAIQTRGVSHVEIRVFDRWGQLIYQEEGFSPMWSGKDKSGNEVSNGKYLLQVNYMEQNGDRNSITSTIHVIR